MWFGSNIYLSTCVCVGTHGNGLGFGNMATLVTRLEFVNGKGEVLDKPSYVSIGFSSV